MGLSNSEARENLEQVVAALEEFKAGIKMLKEQHDQGNHKAVGESIEAFQFAADEMSNVATQVLEGMRAHEVHECPECEKRAGMRVHEVVADTCSWCGRSFGRMLQSKELMASVEKKQ